MRVKEHPENQATRDGQRILFACALQGMGGQEILAKIVQVQAK